ncbi:hypothetical protein ACFYS8_27225 [Kitasatospora sp. NPDC004615]
MADTELDRLAAGKYLLVTSYRKDAAPRQDRHRRAHDPALLTPYAW